ncbi:hypothetical protein GOODEAATRI_009680, partial [Goodea atripinnis]
RYFSRAFPIWSKENKFSPTFISNLISHTETDHAAGAWLLLSKVVTSVSKVPYGKILDAWDTMVRSCCFNQVSVNARRHAVLYSATYFTFPWSSFTLFRKDWTLASMMVGRVILRCRVPASGVATAHRHDVRISSLLAPTSSGSLPKDPKAGESLLKKPQRNPKCPFQSNAMTGEIPGYTA